MQKKNTLEKLSYNLKEAADFLGLGAWSLKRAVYRGDLKVFKPSGCGGKGAPMLFLRNDLESYLMKGEQK